MKILMSFCGLLLAGSGSIASAAIVDVAFQARVDRVRDPGSLLGGAIALGDMIAGRYVYDTTAPDSSPIVTIGDYWYSSPPNGMHMAVGGFVFETDPTDARFLVEVADNHWSPPEDAFVIRSYHHVPVAAGDLVIDNLSWQLGDPTASTMASTALPTAAPRLGDWTRNVIDITGCHVEVSIGHSCQSGYGLDFHIQGHVTAVADRIQPMPEPGSLVLMAIGLAMTAAPRRRRRF